MDFVLSEEQQAIFDMAHDFAEQMIAPHAVNWDQTEQMPKDVLRQSAELGLASIYVPEAHGGSGLSRLDATLVFEALAMGCPSVSAFCPFTIWWRGWFPLLAVMNYVKPILLIYVQCIKLAHIV